ncbi:MAG: hypothetical protein WC699_02500 [Bacteroidales bacterium]|jgi:hypothetical protein
MTTRVMLKDKVYIIRCYDMGSSSIEGVYDTYERAEVDLLKIVGVINERLLRRNDEYHTPFIQDTKNEDEPDVLVQYRNRIRVMEIRQYEVNKPYDDMIDWYDYFPE